MHTPLYQARANASGTYTNLTRYSSEIYRTAVKYAERGVPILPCYSAFDEGTRRDGSKRAKTPKTRHGVKDATTDCEQIASWWSKDSEAAIAIRTGQASRLLVVDEDRPGTLDELPEDITYSRVARTPSGGRHVYFRLPSDVTVKSSQGKPLSGIDIRSENGYVLAPPSTGYQWVNDKPIAEAPKWLLELLEEPSKGDVEDSSDPTRKTSTKVYEPSILEGQRNTTLTKIAGKLHDGTRTADELITDLMRINEERCIPPLGDAEIGKIARSIHTRPVCRTTPLEVPSETLEALVAIENAHLFDCERWKGNAWKSPYSAFVVLLKLAREHGRADDRGIRVQIGVRELATLMGTTVTTARRAIERLSEADIAFRSDTGNGSECGAFTIYYVSSEFTSNIATSSAPLSAQRLRWSKPVIEYADGQAVRVGTVARLGKTAERIVDYLEMLEEGQASFEEIAVCLGIKRSRDLKRSRALNRLKQANVVEVSGETVRLFPEWLLALDRRRELDEEIKDRERDQSRYAEESRLNRLRLDAVKLQRVIADPHEIAECLNVPVADIRWVLGLSVFSFARDTNALPEIFGHFSDLTPAPRRERKSTREELLDFWADSRKAPHYANAIAEFTRKAREHRTRLETCSKSNEIVPHAVRKKSE